jgi:hypothetical protein
MDMRDLPRSFEHELETGGNFARPCFQDRCLRHVIKGVVYLGRSKTLTVIVEHPFRGQVIGIETSLLFLVGVTACADVEVHMSTPYFNQCSTIELVNTWKLNTCSQLCRTENASASLVLLYNPIFPS